MPGLIWLVCFVAGSEQRTTEPTSEQAVGVQAGEADCFTTEGHMRFCCCEGKDCFNKRDDNFDAVVACCGTKDEVARFCGHAKNPPLDEPRILQLATEEDQNNCSSANATACKSPTSPSDRSLPAVATDDAESRLIDVGAGSHTTDTSAGDVGGIEVVTVLTDSARTEPLLRESPFQIRVLGSPSDQHTRLYKPERLHAFVKDLLRQGRNDTFVIMVDAFDVAWLGCRRNLRSIFQSWNRPVFFSTEVTPWPFLGGSRSEVDKELSRAGFPEAPVTRCTEAISQSRACQPVFEGSNAESFGRAGNRYGNRYPNSGCLGGTAKGLDLMLSRLYTIDPDGRYKLRDEYSDALANVMGYANVTTKGKDDQAPLYAYAVKHPSEVHLDTGGSICTSLYSWAVKDFSLDTTVSPVGIFGRPFGKSVCFAHANGRTLHLLGLLQRARVERVQPKDLMTAFHPASIFRFNASSVLHSPLTDFAAELDLGQCFSRRSQLVRGVLFTSVQSVGGFAMQLYRQVESDGIAVLGETSGFQCGVPWRLVASTDPVFIDNAADIGLLSSQKKGPYRWELLLTKYNMVAEAGDCFGWQSQGKTSLVFAPLIVATDSVTSGIRRPPPVCFTKHGPGALDDVISFGIRGAASSTSNYWQPGVIAYAEELEK
eukprot:TRINITY_DN10809_c0_g1_i5.p1 TRINITY_DN10809_c0_g1~~TRINITY_DN10809_c0_g1_i5.p1  ORF type:complete len:655 (-),score=77.78 TRINITY_DN10809_c0_g1_i5:184-2148(-)